MLSILQRRRKSAVDFKLPPLLYENLILTILIKTDLFIHLDLSVLRVTGVDPGCEVDCPPGQVRCSLLVVL